MAAETVRLAWLSLLVSWLATIALADGKVFPTALQAEVRIPDQRALIHFSNQTERLVIETRFAGSGTNFAWVVPLPSQPVIEPATTGLFPTLQVLFQPRIVHRVTKYYIVAALLLLAIFVIRAAGRAGAYGLLALGICLLLLYLTFGPQLAKATASASDSTAVSQQGVSVLERRTVGVFETTTIASTNALAVELWLNANGYVTSTNLEPVLRHYVTNGWVFVASKLHLAQSSAQTNAVHPLSFTFKTAEPVYPMLLTGIDSGPLRVELYVFGDGQALASHFKVERCARPEYPGKAKDWAYGKSHGLSIQHPLLRKWVDGSPVATKLSATLSPADMREDVLLRWRPFCEKGSLRFSPGGAWTIALNVASCLLLAGVWLTWIWPSDGPLWLRRNAIALAVSLVVLGAVYVVLPKTKVRLVHSPGLFTHRNLDEPYWFLGDETNLTAARARSILTSASTLVSSKPWEHSWNGGRWTNELQGGLVHEEDSPGNYGFRETPEGLEYLTYDAQGAEHVLGLLPPPSRR